MIKNEVQYKLTKTSVEGFETRLNWLRMSISKVFDPVIYTDIDPPWESGDFQ